MKIFGTRETKGGTHTRRIQRRPRLWDLAWTMFHWGEEDNKAYRRGASWSLFWAGAELSCAPMVQHPDILVKYLSEIPAEAWCVRLWWSRAGSLPGIFVGETRSLACTRKTYQTSEAFLPVWKRWCSQKQGLNYADIPFMVNRLEARSLLCDMRRGSVWSCCHVKVTSVSWLTVGQNRGGVGSCHFLLGFPQVFPLVRREEHTSDVSLWLLSPVPVTPVPPL